MKRIRLTSPSSNTSTTRIISFEITSPLESSPKILKYEIENTFFAVKELEEEEEYIEEIKLKYHPIHFPVTPALLDRFANFLSILSKTKYLPTLIKMHSCSSQTNSTTSSASASSSEKQVMMEFLPRIAFPSGLSETIGQENWNALLSVFDPPDFFEKSFLLQQQQQQQHQQETQKNKNNNISNNKTLTTTTTKTPFANTMMTEVVSPLQNGIAILSICREDCLNLHPAICELFLWEISRRLRMCSDSKEVQAEFFASSSSSSTTSTEYYSATTTATTTIFEEAKKELKELIAPQIFDEITDRKMTSHPRAAADADDERTQITKYHQSNNLEHEDDDEEKEIK